VLPSGQRTRITAIDRFPGLIESAQHGQAVTLRIADDIDISRGQMIVAADEPATVTTRCSADVCWMSERTPLKPRKQYWIRHTTRRVRCVVERIDDRLDVEHYTRVEGPESLALNDIGRVVIRTMEPLFVDPYEVSRDTGSFILIDPGTQLTVAAGMIRTPELADPVAE